jgi:hypothetical protein
MMKTKSKKEREKRKEIILEGRRLIIDALKANVMKIDTLPTKKSTFTVYSSRKSRYTDFHYLSEILSRVALNMHSVTSFNGIIKRPR